MSDPVAHLLALAGRGEEERRAYLLRHLAGSHQDRLGNVWAGEGRLLLPGHRPSAKTAQAPGGRLYAPGAGDNTSGVAVLLSLPGVVRAFSVGEEGLGNLKGARALDPEVVVAAVDGYLPLVVDRALGSVRFRGPGGMPGETGVGLTPSWPWLRRIACPAPSRPAFMWAGWKGGRR